MKAHTLTIHWKNCDKCGPESIYVNKFILHFSISTANNWLLYHINQVSIISIRNRSHLIWDAYLQFHTQYIHQFNYHVCELITKQYYKHKLSWLSEWELCWIFYTTQWVSSVCRIYCITVWGWTDYYVKHITYFYSVSSSHYTSAIWHNVCDQYFTYSVSSECYVSAISSECYISTTVSLCQHSRENKSAKHTQEADNWSWVQNRFEDCER